MIIINCINNCRFKQLPYAADEDKIIAMKEIKESIKTLIHEEERKPANRSQEPVNKKSRLSGNKLNLFYIIYIY